MYEYVWFREAPYLRLPLVRENASAATPANDLVASATKAAMRELKSAGLVQLEKAA
jgi:hypothetical protein